MNKERRAAIDAARELVERAFDILEEARSAINDIKDEEQEYYDNMPESFQNGDRGNVAQEAINALESAHDDLDNFDFDSVYNSLDEAASS